jgi:hypothetical protein
MHTDRYGNTCGQKWRVKYKIYINKYKNKHKNIKYNINIKYRSLCMITPVITRATRIITMFKEKFGSRTCKTFKIFTKKDSYTCNITHSTESTVV